MTRLKIVIFAIFCTAIAAACGASTEVSTNINVAANKPSNAASSPIPAAAPANTETAAVSGKEIYATNCMICHKDDGKGGKVTVEGKNLKVDDLTTDKMAKRDDAKLAKQILEGAPDEGMPAFKGQLTEQELHAVVQHIRTLQMPL